MTRPLPRDTQLGCDTCGFQTRMTTRATAERSMGRHSCEGHLKRKAAAKRRLARLAESGPEQPCKHGGRHEHGQRARYTLDRCRCRRCRDAANEYGRALVRRHLYGNAPLVDAEPARQHVRQLQDAGMGWKRIAEAAGVDYSVVTKLIYGARGRRPSVRIGPEKAEKILAVRLDLASAAVVDGTGTARRVQALMKVGWSIPRIAAAAGVDRQALDAALRGRRVRQETKDAVRATYDRLWNARPPQATSTDKVAMTRTRRRAEEAGWAPPLAWDDETIDNPKAKPHLGARSGTGYFDEAAVIRRCDGDHTVTLNNAERREVVRRLHSRGLTDGEIVRLTGINSRQVLRDRQAQHLPANADSGRKEAAA